MPRHGYPSILGVGGGRRDGHDAPVNLRDRVVRLAARSLDLTEARIGLDGLLRSAVGYDAAAVSTMDPATKLWTSCFVSGLPEDAGRERERVIRTIEFHGGDVNSYAHLSEREVPVGRLHAATGGDLARSERYAPLLGPMGVVDELRAVLRSRGSCWGTLTLYRLAGAEPFSAADEAAVAGALGAMADLVRLTLLRAALDAPRSVDAAPGVLVVGPGGQVLATSATASGWIAAIDDRGRLPSAVRTVAAAVAAGRGLARVALPARDGRWVVLHGSALGTDGTVSVIIEGARPAVLGQVIAEAYGFTGREREITALAAQGRSTKQMAVALGISPFTVQDHLKAVFAKTGVQSRGELVATLFAQHYEARNDADCTPSPYGWYLDDEIPAAG